MTLEQSTDLNDFSTVELAARLCSGLHEITQSEGARNAMLPIPRGTRSRAVDAFAIAEAGLAPQVPGVLAMPIYLDGQPVGRPARAAAASGTGRVQATASLALLVSAGEDVEVSAAIVSPEGGVETRVRLVLAFH